MNPSPTLLVAIAAGLGCAPALRRVRLWAAAVAALVVGMVAVAPAYGRASQSGPGAARARVALAQKAELLREAKAALLRVIPFDAERVRLLNLRLPTVRLPAGPWSVTAELRPGERFRGATTFALLVEPADGEALRVWATAEVRVRVPVLVAARDLTVGHVVKDADVTLVDRDLSDGLATGLASVDEALGRVVKRPIRAFAALRPSELQKAIAVERGAVVNLRVNLEGLIATARGRALDAGGVGDRVRVENLSSGKTVHGRVLSVNEVDVEL